MGGKNCPPPLTDRPMPAVKGSYITSLAQYCQSLFTGTECYFGAHVKIEEAVLTEGPLDEAIERLKASKMHLEDAKNKIGAVGSLYEQLGGTDFDFGVQFTTLESAITAVDTALMELELVGGSDTVQEMLWERESLTQNFAVATESITAAIAWQSSFATSRSLVAVA